MLNKGIGHSLFGTTDAEVRLRGLAKADFESSDIQRYLPYYLRSMFTGPAIHSGINNLSELLRNPGGLNPNVSAAIAPRLAAESESIARNFSGMRSNQAGGFARSNAPLSLQAALSSALDTAQERAQRGARRDAMTESEGLRRQDIQALFPLLESIFQFTNAGRGQGLGAYSNLAQTSVQRQAAMMALIGSIMGGMAGGGAA